MKQLFGDPLNPTWKTGPIDWYASVGQEMQVTWGLHSLFRLELPELRFMRGQTIWMEGTLDDLRERRRAVLGMARSIVGNDLSGEMEALWPMIGIDTISPRLANAICHAYINPPIRSFAIAKLPEADSINEGFDQLYQSLDVNIVLDSAYRSALFVNLVFIYWDGEKFEPLTPEYFRLCEDMDGNPELWLVRRDKDGIMFDVWNDKVHTVRLGNNGSVLTTEPNPYGRLPGVFLRLNRSQDTYGAGITEAADINAANNLLTMFAHRTALYQGFSVAVATNFGQAIKAGQKIGPGTVLTPNNETSEPGTMPKFEYVTPDGKFEEIGKFKEDRIAAFCMNQDLPSFLVNSTGVPPTGVALQVAERQINARRRRDQNALQRTEQDMARFVEIIAKSRDREKLKVSAFSCKFSEPEMFNSPLDQWEYDKELALNGATSPSAFVQKYYGVQRGMTDEAAITLMKTNQAAFSFLAPTPTISAEPNASTA